MIGRGQGLHWPTPGAGKGQAGGVTRHGSQGWRKTTNLLSPTSLDCSPVTNCNKNTDLQ